ncbi:MAG TPA: nucleotidyltransferase family protein [Phycisphaerae bacterium]|nr:nucleotidyltransferase family protein [Phycisphaerae bacterium]
MTFNNIDFPADKLADFCNRHGVARMWLFGSVLREDFGPDSDIDVLVEFLPGRTPGMFGFGDMIRELTAMIGRRVDLRTPFDLSRHFRPFVLREAKLLHAA